jgi:WD40 repeat protein
MQSQSIFHSQEFEHTEFVTSVKYHPTQHDLFLVGDFKNGVVCWDIRTQR